MKGGHLLSHWSRTQQVIALSSAEAELNSICKAAQEGLAAKHLGEELGGESELIIQTDSSAARGVIRRQGAGKVKHLQGRQLWVQQQEALGNLRVDKISREWNCSDALTHHWSGNNGAKLFAQMGVVRRGAHVSSSE